MGQKAGKRDQIETSSAIYSWCELERVQCAVCVGTVGESASGWLDLIATGVALGQRQVSARWAC